MFSIWENLSRHDVTNFQTGLFRVENIQLRTCSFIFFIFFFFSTSFPDTFINLARGNLHQSVNKWTRIALETNFESTLICHEYEGINGGIWHVLILRLSIQGKQYKNESFAKRKVCTKMIMWLPFPSLCQVQIQSGHWLSRFQSFSDVVWTDNIGCVFRVKTSFPV